MVGSGADRAADRRSGAAGTGAEKEAAVKTVGATIRHDINGIIKPPRFIKRH